MYHTDHFTSTSVITERRNAPTLIDALRGALYAVDPNVAYVEGGT